MEDIDEPTVETKPEIIDANDALDRINDALAEMDVDTLSMELSRITNIGPTVVVDGDDDPVANANRDVYFNGFTIGALREDGTTDKAEPRFYTKPFEPIHAVANPIPIVDREHGGIIGWANGPENLENIVSALQKANGRI